jgi:hypothetical protein
MILSSASLGPEGSGFEISCTVTLINDTGADLVVHSGCAVPTIYDSIELVVTDCNGIVQVQMPFSYHKSPRVNTYGEATLPRGATTGVVSFPFREANSFPKDIRVRLVGTLPDSGYSKICSSETVKVTVRK